MSRRLPVSEHFDTEAWPNVVIKNQQQIIGLLGINFLQDHPFTLDHARNVVIWWE